MKFPLGGRQRDYDSKKSPEGIVNMIAEVNKDGSYKTVKRLEGLTEYSDIVSDIPVRSNLLKNSGYIYLVIGTLLYRVDSTPTATLLGAVGGSGRAQILENSVPDDNQILVLNGEGDGHVYTNANGLVKITDPDFYPTVSGTILDERFWFARKDTNEFFGSEISDGLEYDPLTFASAEEAPDNVVAMIAKKSALWPLGSRTAEYWQTFNDDTLPLRRVKGATKERGITAVGSLAEVGNSFVWLSDDGTVRQITDTKMDVISDLELELKVRGNGTTEYPGFDVTDDAIGFFIDGPVHKIYYLIFPSEGYTWAYDLRTKVTHTRISKNKSIWRINSAVLFDNKVIVGDAFDGKLWILDPAAKTEGDDILSAVLTTPTISFNQDTSISLIEFDMEVGTTSDPDANPMMRVEVTKDGGVNYHVHSLVPVGEMGERRKRVPVRLFGRVVRHTDFGLRLTFTDAERFQLYGADMELNGGY